MEALIINTGESNPSSSSNAEGWASTLQSPEPDKTGVSGIASCS